MELNTHISLALIALFFGVTAKYADLVNEHGLEEYFKGSGILAGFLWGIAGVGILYLSPLAGMTYIAHVLYWFQRVKLEYSNHAIAGVLILLGGFYLYGDFIFQHRNDLLFLFLAYSLTGYLQTYFKEKFPSTLGFWRLRLRIYLIPLLYSFYCHDPYPFIATFFGMLGSEIMTIIYRDYREDVISR